MKKKSVATLSISHSIFLTEQQMYDLHEGNTVKVIGVSLPVWFNKESTSEPAEEVFCKYTLHNKQASAYIQKTKKGYAMNLPQIPDGYDETSGILDVKKWNKMTGDQVNEWYNLHPTPLTSKKLLNIKDGGCKSLSFQIQYNMKISDIKTDVVHFVLIKRIEELNESLITVLD